MKKLNLVLSTALFVSGVSLFADTLDKGAVAATSTAFAASGSFWNNGSSDIVNGSTAANVGNFLSATGSFATPVSGCASCGTNFMASGGQMYTDNGNTPDYVSNLNFVKQAGALSISLLYANSGANGFAEIGIYDASSQPNSVNNHVILQQGNSGSNLNTSLNPGTVYTSGEQFTGATDNGVYSLSNGSPYATWGIYVRTCTAGSISFSACNALGDIVTYYMGMPSQEGSNFTNDTAHQHFALFQAGTNANQYYAGLEDWAFTAADPNASTNGIEGYGDYNDIILGINTSSGVPEPSTLSIMGLGLAAVGLIRRKLKK